MTMIEQLLTETAAVPAGVLPVAEFRDHLRLGTGFADAHAQDALLESHLRAAMAAIEARTAKCLIARSFLWRIAAWRWIDEQALPVAPVERIDMLTVTGRDGVSEVIDPARYRLVPDLHRPRMAATGAMMPAIPTGGGAEIAFVAGFGLAWADVPVDLRQAVLLLAAQYHEIRHEAAGQGGAMPFGVMALIERWRTVRVLGGAGGGVGGGARG